MALGMELATGKTVELLTLIYPFEVPAHGSPEKIITLKGPFEFKVTDKRLTSTDPDLRRHLSREDVEAGKAVPSPMMRNVWHLHVLPEQLEEGRAFIESEIKRYAENEVTRRRAALEALERYLEALGTGGCGFYDRRRPRED